MTNPEIEAHSYFQAAFASISLNIRNAPFDDIRVRHAMQMALDLETINETYYSGFAKVEPIGLNAVKGYNTAFAEWPEELKQYYTYDPKALRDSLIKPVIRGGQTASDSRRPFCIATPLIWALWK